MIGCRAVQRTRRSRARGYTLAELLTTIGFVSILGALAMYGIARWLRHSKTTEAIGSVTTIAQGACAYYDQSDGNQPAGTRPDAAKAMRHFPPSSRASVPADDADVRGKRFQSAIGDWSTSPWPEVGFKLPTAQYYAYSFESSGSGPSAQASAVAHGDLDGNGVKSTFRTTAAPDESLVAKVGKNIEEIDPDE